MLKKEIRLIKNIPENWNAYVLSELGEFKNGINKDKSSFGFGVPFVNLMDVFGKSSIKNSSFSLVDATEKEQEIYNLQAGDILFVRSSVKPEGVGQTCVVVESLASTVYSGFLIRFRPDSKLINWQYATHCFDGSRFRQRLLVHSTVAANTNINQESLKQLAIQLPPLPEQKAIAALLSTWDEAIEKTERLIQAKEKRFKWLLNDLIHVPTKEEMWKQVRMKSLFKERKEGNRGDLPLLSITNSAGVIPHSETNRKDSSNKDKSKYLRICSGDIGYNTMRMWQGVSALSTLEGIVSPAYTICIPGEKLHSQFVAYLFKTPFMIHRFYRYSQGLTSDTWNLKFRHFSEVKMPLPSLEEQQQISETLSSAQQEIDLLKQLADKYKTQKRGLMQKMLTGEWRVKPEIVNQYREA